MERNEGKDSTLWCLLILTMCLVTSVGMVKFVCTAWGKGPVQGKIYNGPQYIEENFPLIDKFLECTVVRSPTSIDAKVVLDDDDNADDVDGRHEKIDDGTGDDGVADGTGDDGVGDGTNDKVGEPDTDDDSENEGKEGVVEHNFKMVAGEGAEVEPRRLGSSTKLGNNSQGLIAPIVMLVALSLFFASLRKRRKETGKMN